MIFNSFEYIIFFIITLIIYYIIPTKYRYLVLLIASYIFYGYSNLKYIWLLIFITILSYFFGYIINKKNSQKIQKELLFIFVVINIGILIYFKYTAFIFKNINYIFSTNFTIENIVVPLGISFFILQAMTYPIDVYRKDVKVEKNIFKFALFISFFPQILSGPIGKSKEMLHQFSEKHNFNYDKFKKGLILTFYGFFEKLVIADCIAKGVNNVYSNLGTYSGFPILIAVILYSFQIYFDFSSYSNISRGCAKMLGYELTNNFKNPYLSDSIKSFWSKWHISLSTWFRDYLYFPLGGSRKGKVRTNINLLIVFIVSGLWHGTSWNFVIWGLLHGFYQIFERNLKLKSKHKFVNVVITFILVTFAWIFFRADNINDALYVISNMFNLKFSNIVQQIRSIGLDKYDLFITVVSIIFIIILENYHYKKNAYKKYLNLPWCMRYIIIYILIFSTIVFGCYGPGFDNSQFIYLGY